MSAAPAARRWGLRREQRAPRVAEQLDRDVAFHEVRLDDNKRAYVDRSTNWVDWGVFGGRNVDGGARNRRSWTPWTVILTFAKVRVAGSNPVFRSK